ncbi:hypothetical protein [Polaromonas aquatica]|uniref:hypothetical protein n=1 Tax=Polaromonas aquatica TaxID=332657 RepID=UPI003D65AFD0
METIIKTLLITLVAGLSGCATIKDPTIFSEKKETFTPEPVKKVLVVIDIGLEYDKLPSGFAFSKADNAKKMYDPLGQAMTAEVKKSGADADYQLHTTNATLVIPVGYSHVWIQKLDRFVHTTSSAGSSVSGRIWKATIIQWRPTAPAAEKFKAVFRSEYEADGPRCFMPNTFPNKDECQQNYVGTVVRQWQKSGLKQ